MSHEKSETIERDGKWINVYGKDLPKAGRQLPGSGKYNTSEEAVAAAKKRSRAYTGRDFEKPLPLGRKKPL